MRQAEVSEVVSEAPPAQGVVPGATRPAARRVAQPVGRWLTPRTTRRAVRVFAGAALLGGLVMVGGLAWQLHERPRLPLRMPVVGLDPDRVRSSFGAPRSGGRRKHRGADLFAPRGTPVCAATSGIVVFVGRNELGGRAVYVLGEGLLTYYAHLESWTPGLGVGQRVERGRLLGTVGDSGNARGTPCHLHFAVHPLRSMGRPVDPVPLLVRSRKSEEKRS